MKMNKGKEEGDAMKAINKKNCDDNPIDYPLIFLINKIQQSLYPYMATINNILRF